MHEYRHVLIRMRWASPTGPSARPARWAGVKPQSSVLAHLVGWLDTARPLPEDAVLAARLARERTVRASSVLLVKPHADEVKTWPQKDIAGTTITAVLKRKNGFS